MASTPIHHSSHTKIHYLPWLWDIGGDWMHPFVMPDCTETHSKALSFHTHKLYAFSSSPSLARTTTMMNTVTMIRVCTRSNSTLAMWTADLKGSSCFSHLSSLWLGSFMAPWSVLFTSLVTVFSSDVANDNCETMNTTTRPHKSEDLSIFLQSRAASSPQENLSIQITLTIKVA